MQRQVPDFLFGEASCIACRVPKRWAAIECSPNQAGAVATPVQERSGDFTQLDFTTEPGFVDVVGDSKRRGIGLPMLRATKPLYGLPSQRRFPDEQDQVAHRIMRACRVFGQGRDQPGSAIVVEIHAHFLMTKVLEDVALAVTAIQELTEADRVGVVGHSFGGNVALFAGALDTRISFVCASGAACSFRHKLAHGTGLGMELVIPDFATHFDIDDLIRCISPRKLFVVSSDEDPFAADAEEVVERARPAFEAAGALEHLQRLRVDGAHGLDAERFSAIIDWLVAA